MERKPQGGRLEHWFELPLIVGPVWLSSKIIGYCYDDPRWVDGHAVVTGFLVSKGNIFAESENTLWTLGEQGSGRMLTYLLHWFR
jgi:hypothetical protein